jgi:hypothetical protein
VEEALALPVAPARDEAMDDRTLLSALAKADEISDAMLAVAELAADSADEMTELREDSTDAAAEEAALIADPLQNC